MTKRKNCSICSTGSLWVRFCSGSPIPRGILERHGFTPLNIKEGIIGLSGAGAQVVK